jgi:L-ascorbate metabolism protein UlaG (beta-lactamase superfamily)
MSLYSSIFPRFHPRREHRPLAASPAGPAVRVTWLGTAGYIVETDTTTLLIDPFLSRPSLSQLLGKLSPDEEAIRSVLPSRVDAVLCSHSHYDHLLDAPLIARWTGAKLFGTVTSCAFGRAAGLADEQLVTVPAGGLRTSVGGLAVRFVPSLHGRILFGHVPLSGELRSPVELPARAWHYRMGGVFGILLSTEGVSIYHNGSADLVDGELSGTRADVALIGLAGRGATRDYVKRLLRALEPSVVVPTHHDAFFAPLDHGVHLLPGIDLDGFTREVAAERPSSAIITPFYGETIVIPRGGARDAGLLSTS